MLLVLLHAAALLGVARTVGGAGPGPKPRNPKCTCDDPSLCESLPPVAAGSPQPAEALAFYSGEVSPSLLPRPAQQPHPAQLHSSDSSASPAPGWRAGVRRERLRVAGV